jgi:NAD-specific glutamate dehydrogenase
MPEEIKQFETEVTELARAVEEKRQSVEREAGIVAETPKEWVRAAVTEHVLQNEPSAAARKTSTTSASYLDDLSTEDQQTIHELLSIVEEKGIKQALAVAETKSPYLLDVFHDELTDKLYTTLKERGFIS